MKKLLFSILIVSALSIYFAPSVHAYAISPKVVNEPLFHRVICGIENCKVVVTVDLPFETFAPAQVSWRHRIGNSEYTKPVVSSTTYLFIVKRETQVITVEAQSYGMTFTKTFRVDLPANLRSR